MPLYPDGITNPPGRRPEQFVAIGRNDAEVSRNRRAAAVKQAKLRAMRIELTKDGRRAEPHAGYMPGMKLLSTGLDGLKTVAPLGVFNDPGRASRKNAVTPPWPETSQSHRFGR